MAHSARIKKQSLVYFRPERVVYFPRNIHKSWLQNWDNLSTFFEYDQDVRRVIYTTNPIEGMHRQVRKITKTKGAFTSE